VFYTGNDDNIIPDLLAEFALPAAACICGGCWAMGRVDRRAVELVERSNAARRTARADEILANSAVMTDANGALFDVSHGFAGCIVGLYNSTATGIAGGRWCLTLGRSSPGQLPRSIVARRILNWRTMISCAPMWTVG
jgi:hypothetical protein